MAAPFSMGECHHAATHPGLDEGWARFGCVAVESRRFAHPDGTFEVEGRILHASTRAPVRGLHVGVEAWEGWVGRQVGVTTGSDGSFYLDPLSEMDRLILRGTGSAFSDTIAVDTIPWALR